MCMVLLHMGRAHFTLKDTEPKNIQEEYYGNYTKNLYFSYTKRPFPANEALVVPP
jgi:hypothetical protein